MISVGGMTPGRAACDDEEGTGTGPRSARAPPLAALPLPPANMSDILAFSSARSGVNG
jgi:hypothetical protein